MIASTQFATIQAGQTISNAFVFSAAGDICPTRIICPPTLTGGNFSLEAKFIRNGSPTWGQVRTITGGQRVFTYLADGIIPIDRDLRSALAGVELRISAGSAGAQFSTVTFIIEYAKFF